MPRRYALASNQHPAQHTQTPMSTTAQIGGRKAAMFSGVFRSFQELIFHGPPADENRVNSTKLDQTRVILSALSTINSKTINLKTAHKTNEHHRTNHHPTANRKSSRSEGGNSARARPWPDSQPSTTCRAEARRRRIIPQPPRLGVRSWASSSGSNSSNSPSLNNWRMPPQTSPQPAVSGNSSVTHR
jgi:hypothetical protein